MPRSRLGIAGMMLLMLLGFPRSGSAGLIDFIWAMSGPQLVGVTVLECKHYFGGDDGLPCKFLNGIRGGKDDILALESGLDPGRWRFAFEGIVFASTGKNPDGNDDHRAGKVLMVGADPMFEYAWYRHSSGWTFYQGVGASLNWLRVSGASNFGNGGLKLRPVGLVVPIGMLDLDFAFNIRLYADGFGRDQFGFGPPIDGDRPKEWLYGGSFGFAW